MPQPMGRKVVATAANPLLQFLVQTHAALANLGLIALWQALDYIIKGIPTGSYVKHSANATNFRGVMTWSVNWDAYGNIFEFSNFYRTYMNSLP